MHWCLPWCGHFSRFSRSRHSPSKTLLRLLPVYHFSTTPIYPLSALLTAIFSSVSRAAPYTLVLVMSIGNRNMLYQENTNTKSVFGISVPNFLVFYRCLEYGLLKIWLNIAIFRQNSNRFGIWFLWFPFIGIGLVPVCHFPENGISTLWRI